MDRNEVLIGRRQVGTARIKARQRDMDDATNRAELAQRINEDAILDECASPRQFFLARR